MYVVGNQRWRRAVARYLKPADIERLSVQHRHYSRTENTSDTWLTDPRIIRSLGEFDLDPAAPVDRPWPTARQHFTIEDDGLKQEWEGRVWLNPPYGRQTQVWLRRLADHGDGIALIFARLGTRMFRDYVWARADAVLFLDGRLSFLLPDGSSAGTAPAPSCLIAYGKQNVEAIAKSGLDGCLVMTRDIKLIRACAGQKGARP